MNNVPFGINDDDRYSRLQLIGWWDQERLRNSRIMVVGVGALGNEVLKNLAMVGIGQLVIVDFDTIENSNLSRSVLFRAGDSGQRKVDVAREAIQQLNPDVRVDAIDGDVLTDIGLGLVRQMDVVISCLDNREARLWVNRMCWKVNVPWIDGGIQEINGVAKVFRPPHGACYECAMTDKDYQLIQLRYSCPLLKREELQQGKVPTAPTIASIIGGLQAQEALKLLHDLPTADGSALVFNGAANQFYQTRYQHREDCLSHETFDSITEVSLAVNTTLESIADELQQRHRFKVDRLELDRDFVTEFLCSGCSVSQNVMRPLPNVNFEESRCPNCQQPMVPQMTHSITLDEVMARHPLSELGIPDNDIVRIHGYRLPDSEEATLYVQLACHPS